MRTSIAPILILALMAPAHGANPDDPGVRPDLLRVGLHLAMTGAESLPPGIGDGARLYWRYLHDDLGLLVHGRRVEVDLANDEDTPTTAVAVCNALAQDAFLLVGLSGDEQTQACAEYATPRGLPYLTIGGATLAASSTSAFSVSATVARQAEMVAAHIVSLGTTVDRYGYSRVPIAEVPIPVAIDQLNEPDGRVRVGLVRSNVPTSDESEESLRRALRARGRDLDEVYTVVKSGSGSEAAQIARDARRDLVDVLVTETGFAFTALLISDADQTGYAPRFISFGVTSGIDALPEIVCSGRRTASAAHGASTFSPWPAWADVRAGGFDPHIAAAVSKYGSSAPGDLIVAGWGLMKIVHRVLESAGADPTRSGLLALLDGGFSATTGVYPPVAFGPGDREGGDQMHRLEADCSLPVPGFVTREAFVGAA